MFNMHGHGCGPRGGRFERGPFSMSWEVRGDRHGGRHEHGRGGGGGRRRMFDGGELKLVLLKLIADAPRHGYDLIREIERMTGGAYAPSPGVVYPTLTLLGDMGLVEDVASEGAKKQLAITAEGRQHLVERQDEVAAAMARLAALAAFTEKTDSAPIRRAMQNLKMALQQRLGEASADKNTAFDIAEMIDEVTRKIERL